MNHAVGENFKILVVDDDPETLLLTSMILEKAGYEVLEASTGEQSLQVVRTQRPDLILLDVMLPDISGMDVSRQIKADADLRDTFIILLSGVQVSSEYQADGLNVGVEGYITRPVSNKELLARVRAMERIKRAEDALREKEKELMESVTALKGALAQIKTLQGLIPICASCKKIRDDRGYWNQLEIYITQHTDAVFTHGICPDCAAKELAKIKKGI